MVTLEERKVPFKEEEQA